ncbi:MAG: hypothetical protein ACTSPA_02515 [Promethearchaeota archaeon]
MGTLSQMYKQHKEQKLNLKSVAVLSGHSIREELEFYNPDFIIPNINYIPKILHKLFPDDNFE